VLQKVNKQLRAKALHNYASFLGHLFRSIDHEKAREGLSLLERRDFTGLIMFADSLSSTEFGTHTQHRVWNQIASLVRKYPFPPGSVALDPRARALETFLGSEHHCKRLNQRFYFYLNRRSPHERALSDARSWISYTLGDLNLAEVWDQCAFGPGASIGVNGNATNMARKFLAKRWSVSPSAVYYAGACLKTDPLFFELLNLEPGRAVYSVDPDLFNRRFASRLNVVTYNKVTFVPKTAKTERTIAVEPLLNGFIQKGIDIVMRKRLKRVGIDLEDQTLNQGLALFGSTEEDDDPYVTIDLSSASDSISTGLCRYLLPSDWFQFMDSVRSKAYLLDGEVTPVKYEKFTTMGNGFCFPLETLIFASLCHVAYREVSRTPDFSVYGDDIIVRSSVASRVLDLLRICGFKANRSKTFLEGPFRESCGADWFKGEDVRPVTLDYAFDSVQSIFKFCNIARRKSWTSSILHEGLDFLESLIPSELRFVRPFPGPPDTALEVTIDEFMASPMSRWNKATFSWSWVEVVSRAWSDFQITRAAGYNVALTRGALTGALSRTPFAERRKTCTKIARICHSGGWSLWEPGSLFSRSPEAPYPL